MVDEQDLARRAAVGEDECFEQLVRRFQTPLLRYLLRRLPTRSDAEDVLQETFVRAYRKLRQYRSDWPFRTWIFTIACRLADRHRRPAPTLSELSDLPGRETQPLPRLEARERKQALWDIARSRLSDTEFTALWLHYAEQMPLEQVGQVIGRSCGATRTMLHRSRRRLLPLVQHLHAEPLPASSSLPAGEGWDDRADKKKGEQR